MSQPAIGYLDPIFVDMMEELKALLRYTYQTKNLLTFPVSGPGSVGMEYCFVNMVAPGDKVIVCRNGVFGGRMIENVERCGGTAIVVEAEWGSPIDPQKLEDALKANRDARLVAFVHAETSTGVQSDAKTLVEIAHKYDALTIVDAVTSLGGTPVLVDEWGLDAVYSASQKCLSCTPGLSPVTLSERVVDHVKARKDKIHSWFMDMNLLLGYWGETTPHLSSHRAHQFAVRAARSAAFDPRRRPGELLGASRTPPSGTESRSGGHGPAVPGERALSPAADECNPHSGRDQAQRGRGPQDTAERVQS